MLCKICGEEKTREEFPKRNKTRCKTCKHKYAFEYRARNREAVASYKRSYRKRLAVENGRLFGDERLRMVRAKALVRFNRRRLLSLLKLKLRRDMCPYSEADKASMSQYQLLYTYNEGFRQAQICKARGYRINPDIIDGTLTSKSVRQVTYMYDDCLYCGRAFNNDRSIDHVHPISLGGMHSFNNVIVCCRSCNQLKRNMPIDEWLQGLESTQRDIAKIRLNL